MNRLLLITVTFTAAVVFVFVLTSCSRPAEKKAAETEKAEPPPEISDPELAAAFKMIQAAPDSAKGHVLLSAAYIKLARRTSDFSLNRKAEAAIDAALGIEPNNINAKKLKASLQATFHRFPLARSAAEELTKETPDDPFLYGVLTDANAELGNYDEALAAAQKMVDLKPNSSSYARVAHIRSLYGDKKGSIEMYRLAVKTADPADKEGRAWALVQLAKENLKYGEFIEAQTTLEEALRIDSQYLPAIVETARTKAFLGEFSKAEEMLVNANARLPQTDGLILLGDIYSVQDREAEAEAEYERALVVARQTDGDIHRFALLWADRDVRLEEALEIAEKDFETNKDIYGADILAWTYFKNRRFEDAKWAIDQALRLGSNDARILYHAGMIENALGNKSAARRLLKSAIETNPGFDLVQAPKAREAFNKLS